MFADHVRTDACSRQRNYRFVCHDNLFVFMWLVGIGGLIFAEG